MNFSPLSLLSITDLDVLSDCIVKFAVLAHLFRISPLQRKRQEEAAAAEQDAAMAAAGTDPMQQVEPPPVLTFTTSYPVFTKAWVSSTFYTA